MKSNLELISKGSKKLETLKKEREALSSDIYAAVEMEAGDAEKTTDKNADGKEKIKAGITRYGEFEKTIADLSVDLSTGLNDYVLFAQESKNYQGLEKFVKILSTPAANRMRIKRLSKQSPKENLKLILDYAEQIFREITEERAVAVRTYDKLRANGRIISGKIAEFGPKEAELKEKLDILEEEYTKMTVEYDQSGADKQAEMIESKNEMHDRLTQMRHEYDQVLTIFKNAQETIKGNELTRDSYEKIARDLGRQATMIKEKIDGVTEIYLAAPTAIKIMMTTRGMETVDESINTATDRSIDIITAAAEGVSDATLKREEADLVDPEVMKGYMDRMTDTMTEFNERFDAVREKARQSQKDRYNS